MNGIASNATIGGTTKADEQPHRACGELEEIARMLMHGDKGLLAMDESNPTCNARFARYGIPQTAEARRAYRELLVSTPGLGNSISGVILYDETLRQQMTDGTPFARAIERLGIIPGIKVDTGAKEMAGHANEKVTEGLDGLRARLAEYSKMGARFAKWRAVIAIGDGIPSLACIEANTHALARYAALCQEARIVPVVEPEVLMAGDHTLKRCCELTERVLRALFGHLYTQGVRDRGDDTEAEHDPSGVHLHGTGKCGRGSRRHRWMSLASRPGCRSRGCLPFGRPIGRARFGSLERDECTIPLAAAVGVDLLLRPGHPAARVGDLARRGGQHGQGTASAVPSGQVQLCSAAWGIQRGGRASVMIRRRGSADGPGPGKYTSRFVAHAARTEWRPR